MQTLKLWPLTSAEVNRAPVSRLIDWAMQPAPKLPQISDPAHLGRKDYIDLILMGVHTVQSRKTDKGQGFRPPAHHADGQGRNHPTCHAA